jgi:serine/threonine protein phosphatase PrpC
MQPALDTLPLRFPINSKLLRTMKNDWIELGSASVTNRRPAFYGSRFLGPALLQPWKSGAPVPPVWARVMGGLFEGYSPSCGATFVANNLQNRLRRLSTRKCLESQDLIHGALLTDLDLAGRPESKTDGCRGIWFVGEVESLEAADSTGTQASLGNPLLGQLTFHVANLGTCRAFGVALDSIVSSTGVRETRRKIVPLSQDHRPGKQDEARRIFRAGGTICDETDVIGKNPLLNASRQFGFHCEKRNEQLSPYEQKVIAVPEVTSWTPKVGEFMILATHSLFENSGRERTPIDSMVEVATTIMEEKGRSAAEAASAICDKAIAMGSVHNLDVLIVRRTGETDLSKPSPLVETFEVRPGPIYPTAMKLDERYRQAVHRDAVERLGLKGGLAELLSRRWQLARDVLKLRKEYSILQQCFPLETTVLSSVMEDEADFFGDGPSESELFAFLPSVAATFCNDAAHDASAAKDRLLSEEKARMWFEVKAQFR